MNFPKTFSLLSVELNNYSNYCYIKLSENFIEVGNLCWIGHKLERRSYSWSCYVRKLIVLTTLTSDLEGVIG